MIQRLLRKLTFVYTSTPNIFPNHSLHVTESLVSYKLRSYNTVCTLHPATNLPLLGIRTFSTMGRATR